jgi:peroxiredoxin
MSILSSRAGMTALFAAILAVAVIGGLIISNMSSSSSPIAEKPSGDTPVPSANTGPSPEIEKPEALTPSTSTEPIAPVPARPTLAQIIPPLRKADAIEFPEYIGRPAPDFKVRALDGTDITLGSLRGKNVMVVFWATWCPPCKKEIPDLIRLRNAIPQDRLAIIAISTDRASDDPVANNIMMPELIAAVKEFVAAYKINYTVAMLPNRMGHPFDMVGILPTTVFIRPDGTIKLCVKGLLPPGYIEAILAAD